MSPETSLSLDGFRIDPISTFVEFGKPEIEQSIPSRFEQQVASHTGRIAVRTHDNTQATYDELNRAANRVANSILTLRGDNAEPVVLLLEQGIASIMGVIGVLKAGKFFVQLEPSNPPARNMHILQDSEAGLIVTNERNIDLAKDLAHGKLQVLNLDEIDANVHDRNPGLPVSPDALADILYTSGSTGQPKGVVQNHRNVLHNVMRHTNAFCIGPDDRQTLLYPGGPYGGVRDMFDALLNGAALHVFPVKQEGVPDLARWLKQEEITIYCSVATVFRQLVATLTGTERFPKLRLIKLGGEATYSRDVAMYQANFSDGCIMHCGLGATETGVVRNYFVDKNTKIAGRKVPLGYPAEDMEVLLFDEAGQNVGPGHVAEIAIRSRYIALGYWRQPELSRAVFIPDPEGGERRIYRTGDLGYLDPNGVLEHRGRKDQQVKIRGNRVEVTEIEIALLEMDVIKEAVVVSRQESFGDDRLVAYLVPTRRPAPTVSTIRRTVAQKLADYMVPSTFVLLDALPLLPNGKIDRSRLPVPAPCRPDLDTPFSPPDTTTEETLVPIWGEILGFGDIGTHDNFFELGGHSVMAVRILSRVREAFKVDIPLQTLFQKPTAAEFATAIDMALLNAHQSSNNNDREEGSV